MIRMQVMFEGEVALQERARLIQEQRESRSLNKRTIEHGLFSEDAAARLRGRRS